MVKRVLLAFCLAFIILTFDFPSLTYAADDFSTSYDVTYQVQDTGITQVVERINLKNLTSQYYASNFTLTIGSTTIKDVSAFDNNGPLQTQVNQNNNKTSIQVLFNQQIVGQGKSQTFTLQFSSADFAQEVGKSWEVNLPKTPDSPNLESYNLSLVVPVKFGEPSSLVPTPKSESQVSDRLILNFDKDQIKDNGVSVNFGSNQSYRFTLNYNLDNSSLVPYLTSITLPPDTNYQDVSIDNINPKPLNVTLDKDGNYQAWYKIARGEHEHVLVSGVVKLYINSKDKLVPKITPDEVAQWTKADKYWEKDNPVIVNTLNDLFKNNSPQTTHDKVSRIYHFVVDTLKYDPSRYKTIVANPDSARLGAVTALNNPNDAVCMEFTDLFIALTRAAGIPARELDGFAYTTNTTLRPLSLDHDLLHAWPEYFDDQRGWVMVDPTWENTSGGVNYFDKFDLSHVTLAIKGVSSETPFTTDQVNVKVTDEQFQPDPLIDIQVKGPDSIWSGFPAKFTVDVYNKGETAIKPTNLILQTNYLKILGSSTVELPTIPPYGYSEYIYDLRTPNLWQGSSDVATIIAGDQTYAKPMTVKPFFLFQPLTGLIILTILLIFGIYFSLLSLHLFHRKLSSEKIKLKK